MQRTKVVATLGPATGTRERIAAIVAAGVDVVRLNMSHGNHAEHARRIEMVRDAAESERCAVAVLLDLQGPKIRTGSLAGGGPVKLEAGQRFVITHRDVPGDASCVSTSYHALSSDVKAGDRILLSDGLIELCVVSTSGSDVTTEVVNGGLLKPRQGINLPGVAVSAGALTEQDVLDLHFGLQLDVDYIAISFVRSAADVRRVKELIAEYGSDVPVIAKIEKPEALAALLPILDVADGVMVARGDLGVELEPEKVPLAQKRIIREANARAKPVITATQMLESMVEHPRPTRAEASDVANAILDGSDAVMLSGETAAGKYPVEAVLTMDRIARELEADPEVRRLNYAQAEALARDVDSTPEAIGAAVASIASQLDSVRSVWAFTQSGSTARILSKRRMQVPILAFTPNERVYRRMALLWGVVPFLTNPAQDREALEAGVLPMALASGLVKLGDTIVVTGSHPFGAQASTNFLKIQQLD